MLDLWSLFDFLMPGYLGDRARFKALTASIVNKARGAKASDAAHAQAAAALSALHRQVLPFVLRRLKSTVLKELPDKIVQVGLLMMLGRLAVLMGCLVRAAGRVLRPHTAAAIAVQGTHHVSQVGRHQCRRRRSRRASRNPPVSAWLRWRRPPTVRHAARVPISALPAASVQSCGPGGSAWRPAAAKIHRKVRAVANRVRPGAVREAESPAAAVA